MPPLRASLKRLWRACLKLKSRPISELQLSCSPHFAGHRPAKLFGVRFSSLPVAFHNFFHAFCCELSWQQPGMRVIERHGVKSNSEDVELPFASGFVRDAPNRTNRAL